MQPPHFRLPPALPFDSSYSTNLLWAHARHCPGLWEHKGVTILTTVMILLLQHQSYFTNEETEVTHSWNIRNTEAANGESRFVHSVWVLYPRSPVWGG